MKNKTFAEEFKLYENLWQPLNEWVDNNGAKINTTTPAARSSSNATTQTTSTALPSGNLYVVFNYYRPDDLDDFCILLAETDRTTTIDALIEMAELSVKNFGRYKNTLVCYKIDPDEYDMTEAEFNDAAESKHDYCGEGLHHEFTDVVYVLSHLAANEKPLYTIDRNIVEIEFYDEFLGQKINNTGITFDDIYDSNYDSNLIDKVYNDPDFQKFMKDKLTKTITNAL